MMSAPDYAPFMAALQAYYASPVRRSLTECFRICARRASEQGWAVPSLSTARRHISKLANKRVSK